MGDLDFGEGGGRLEGCKRFEGCDGCERLISTKKGRERKGREVRKNANRE